MATFTQSDLDTHLTAFMTALDTDDFTSASRALTRYSAVWMRIGRKTVRDEASESEYPHPKDLRRDLHEHRDMVNEEAGSSYDEGFVSRPETTH